MLAPRPCLSSLLLLFCLTLLLALTSRYAHSLLFEMVLKLNSAPHSLRFSQCNAPLTPRSPPLCCIYGLCDALLLDLLGQSHS